MKRILYILFILLIALVVAEIGLRQSGNYLTYSEKTNGDYESDLGKESTNFLHLWTAGISFDLDKGEYSYPYQINQLGLREVEIPRIDTVNNVVLVFGDSFIEGVGAPYDSTFTRFLEDILTQDFGNYKVYNFGISGADPFYNFKAFEKLAILRPSHVIFSINNSDIQDYLARGGFERFNDDEGIVRFREAPWFLPLHRKSHVARFVLHTIMDYDANFIRISKKGPLEDEALINIEKSLMLAKEICDHHGIKFMSLSHPFPNEVCNVSRDFKDNNDFFARHISHVPMAHLSEKMFMIMNRGDCASFSWPIDGHFNSKGYQLMAEAFYLEVLDNFNDFFDPNHDPQLSPGNL